MNNPRISVIICTYNRAVRLNLALQSLARQTATKDAFEVIVIDNCSTDNTQQVVENHRHSNGMAVSYHYESQPGLSYARNTGLHLANFDYLLYLDDDVIAEPGLIRSYLDYLETSDSDYLACLGGKVLIAWENGDKPVWLPGEFLFIYGHLDLGEAIQATPFAVGCNMLWKKDVLLKFGGFSTDLGRIGDKKLASEETELMNAVRKSNYHIFYIPTATVHHWAPKERQTRKYIYEILYWLGVSKAISEKTQAAKWKVKFEHAYVEFYRLFNAVRSRFQSRRNKISAFNASGVVFIRGKMKFFAGYVKQVFFS